MDKQIRWTTPASLRGGKEPTLHFPINALPPILREMAGGIAETTSTDVAMAGTAILSAISYCFTGMYRMCGKSDHTEPLVLNSLTIAEPSFRKSPVVSMVKRPFVQFTQDWNENHKTEIYKAQAERKILENQISALEKEDDADTDEIANLRTRLCNMDTGKFRRIVVDDITPESLVHQLEQNDTLLMISDEAGMLANFGGRYSNNVPNLDLLLKSWNGETYISDRATRESIVLKKPYLSISLACQPYLFDSMMSNQAFRGSGLVARFVYCFPKNNIGLRKYDTVPISEKTAENYRLLVYKLLNDKFCFNDEIEQYFHFDDKAYKEFVDIYNNFIEPNLVTEMAFCKDWGGKYHGLILRICGVIHAVKCVLSGTNPIDVRVGIDTFCNAMEIAEYYREQAIYAYSLGDTDIGIFKAERVLGKIRAKRIDKTRQNDLYKICRCSLFKNAADFTETMEMLEEYGYIYREEVKTEGSNRSGVMVYVNPQTHNREL